MKKVYCENCKYVYGIGSTAKCCHTDNLIFEDIAYTRVSCTRRIEECNRNNDCKLFEERFLSKLCRLIGF